METHGTEKEQEMAFGHRIRLEVSDDLTIELAPILKEDVHRFVESGGMQNRSITRYLNNLPAQTLEDEENWYDNLRADKTKIAWGIHVVDGDQRLLIGTTALNTIEGSVVRSATSGIVISVPEFWGKGIASLAHVARTRYAFEQLGLHRIKSAVVVGNDRSLNALLGMGYVKHHIDRNFVFLDGSLHHEQCLELINPLDPFWSQWWHGERVPDANRKARAITLAAIESTKSRITLL